MAQATVLGISKRLPEIPKGVRPHGRFGGTPVRRARHWLFIRFVERFSIPPACGFPLGLYEILMGVGT